MSGAKLYFKPPKDLAERIHVALHEGKKAEGRASSSVWRVRKPMPWRISWPWISLAASAVLVAMVAWRFGSVTSRPSPDDLLAQEVLASHVRSLMANHLTTCRPPTNIRSSHGLTAKSISHLRLRI